MRSAHPTRPRLSRFAQYLRRVQGVLLSLAIVTPLGFATKFYSGPAGAWVNDSLGGVLYVLFWSLLARLLLPRVKTWVICVAVLTLTCFLEVLQLWHPPPLESVRATFIGATLVGTTFVWSDFVYYLLGAALGSGWLRALERFAAHE